MGSLWGHHTGPAGWIQARNWHQILEQGDSTWVWATGVLSQNTAEYSSLTCDQMTNVPAGHECSLIHFPQWAVLTLFSMWVMTCKRLGITAYKELRKRCFCCSARLCSHSLLPQSSLLFFSTPQSSCRTWLSTVPKYIHSEFQSPRERRRISFPISNPGEELWLVQFESAVHSRTNQQWPEWRILHLNCGSQSYHLTGLEGQMLADKTTGVHDKMWLLKGRIQVRG